MLRYDEEQRRKRRGDALGESNVFFMSVRGKLIITYRVLIASLGAHQESPINYADYVLSEYRRFDFVFIQTLSSGTQTLHPKCYRTQKTNPRP